ncbi:unnamed protein product [Moneuplotes crassus]|uniref:CSC1/OSCA1-like 7TM region domain-containing protein n=1 Tax=Euplotes crassus TaxID=5936 RepID=A0AAD1Y2B1_EUPCR|nr:unnamed protein product [Moneuplotes crassus]
MYSDDEKENELKTFILFFSFHAMLLFGAILLWNGVWLKPYGYDIYVPKKKGRRTPSALGKIQTITDIVKEKLLLRYWRYVFSKLWKFDRKFWQGISPDAYLYLLLQKALIRLSCIIFIVSLSLSIFFNYGENVWSLLKNWSTAKPLIFDIFFGSNVQLSTMSSVYLQTAMCIIVSLATILTVLSLMSSLKSLHAKTLPYKSEYNCEWLNSHSLYFTGLLKHDGHGKLFEAIINDFIEPYGGRIITAENTMKQSKDFNIINPRREEHKGIFMVKNYRKFTKYLDKKENIKDLLEFTEEKEPLIRRLCVRKKKRTKEYLLSKMNDYDMKINTALDDGFKSACSVYAVFDSYTSMLQCLQIFNTCEVLSLDCSKICKRASTEKIMKSINSMQEEQEYLIQEYEKDGIYLNASLPTDPVDIVWFNRGSNRHLFFLKKYLWNLLGLLLIVFISTPAVLFQTLKTIGEDNLNLEILDYIPFVQSYSSYIPTIIILCINLLLLIMIDQIAVSEGHAFHNSYQKSIFNKAVVYLHLNIVLFPFLGLQETPVFKLLNFESTHKDYIRDFSMLDSTPFFSKLILQYGVFGGIFYLLRMGEVIVMNFSPAFAHYVRTKFTTTQEWRRKPEYVFQYGYFYSQMVTIFTIVILFSSTAPLIAALGAIYYVIRNCIDGHLLISVHKKEIDSGIELFNSIIPCLLFSLICYQAFMLIYFYLNAQIVPTYIISIMVFLTLIFLFVVRSQRATIHLLKLYAKREDELGDHAINHFSTNLNQGLEENCRSKYFIIGSSNSTIEVEEWEKWADKFYNPALVKCEIDHPNVGIHSKPPSEKILIQVATPINLQSSESMEEEKESKREFDFNDENDIELQDFINKNHNMGKTKRAPPNEKKTYFL